MEFPKIKVFINGVEIKGITPFDYNDPYTNKKKVVKDDRVELSKLKINLN